MFEMDRKAGEVSNVRAHSVIRQNKKNEISMKDNIVLTINRESFTLKNQTENNFEVGDKRKVALYAGF